MCTRTWSEGRLSIAPPSTRRCSRRRSAKAASLDRRTGRASGDTMRSPIPRRDATSQLALVQRRTRAGWWRGQCGPWMFFRGATRHFTIVEQHERPVDPSRDWCLSATAMRAFGAPRPRQFGWTPGSWSFRCRKLRTCALIMDGIVDSLEGSGSRAVYFSALSLQGFEFSYFF
jgi:hypothetical protein